MTADDLERSIAFLAQMLTIPPDHITPAEQERLQELAARYPRFVERGPLGTHPDLHGRADARETADFIAGYPVPIPEQEVPISGHVDGPFDPQEKMIGALRFYADKRNWLNYRELRGVPGFHGRQIAVNALAALALAEDALARSAPDGFTDQTWAAADDFRESYCTGPGVAGPGVGASGHERVGILRRPVAESARP